jgi:hypothetical protein
MKSDHVMRVHIKAAKRVVFPLGTTSVATKTLISRVVKSDSKIIITCRRAATFGTSTWADDGTASTA